MTHLFDGPDAFGAPGIAPRWTRGLKDAVGTAYSAASRVWYTASAGVLNEVYYPTIDSAQIRDLQYLVTDGETFFHDERRHTESVTRYTGLHALAFRMVNTEHEGRWRITKDVIADPHSACVLQRTRFEVLEHEGAPLRLYVLLAPHLAGVGWRDTAEIAARGERLILSAHDDGTWLACAATLPFRRCSAGYVGTSDGWTDLHDDMAMTWTFARAADGNVALMGELDVEGDAEFTLGLAFGDGLHNAVATLEQSLGVPFEAHEARFNEQWERVCGRREVLEDVSGDGGLLFRRSHALLLAHEDKLFPGAMIASLSIPWGESKGAEELGGYHLVWPRDMVNTAGGLLALGRVSTPLRALIYLACAQREDGGFYQNFWIDGRPYWQGVQLDEMSFPILLAWEVRELGALQDFDPTPMVLQAAGYLVREGPATPQERWEEAGGYSPSTLAANIAALTCAASFAEAAGDPSTADLFQTYADFLACHVESWTVTTAGTLLPDVPRHYIRIHPVEVGDAHPNEDPNEGTLIIANRAPGERFAFPARDVVDAGFLQLVRYGIVPAGDALVEDSLRVVDAVLKSEFPFGPGWHRYNHDGYGQRADGGPYVHWGRGRVWPLLTGERGHYELAAGRDPTPYIRAMEAFATEAGLLPEQTWDEPDLPEHFLRFGGPTGAATPLAWAHAEYVKLLRSARDGEVFDLVPAVRDRYADGIPPFVEVWKFNRQPREVRPGAILRVQALAAFRLRLSRDGGATYEHLLATGTSVGVWFVDVPVSAQAETPLSFTFHWTDVDRWEGRDFEVRIKRDAGRAGRS